MSFSDFKGSGASRSNTNAAKRPTTSASAALGNINAGGRDDSGVGVISESLLQYQVSPYNILY
jgi:hypothetical protein